MAAPTLISVSFAAAAVASPSGTLTTPTAVSWQTGDVVVVLGGTEGGGPETWTAPTTTGTGLTFTQQQLHASASSCGAACYTAIASASSSGTFTLKQPYTGSVNENVSLAVYIFRGSAGVGASSIAASATRTLALTPTGADGAILWGVFDWAAVATVAETPTATVHSTAAPGPQASPQAAAITGRYTYYIEELDDQTSAGSVSYGVTGTGTGPFTIIALEVKASAGGGGSTAIYHPKSPSRVPNFRASNY